MQCVSYDNEGMFGPAIYLIWNANHLNKKALTEISETMATRFFKSAKIVPKEKEAFCALVRARVKEGNPLTPAEIVATDFFQSLRKNEDSPYHAQVKSFMVPRMYEPTKPFFSIDNITDYPEVIDWTAYFVESYVPEKVIHEHIELQDEKYRKALAERINVGTELTTSIKQGKITEKDFDDLLSELQSFFEQRKELVEHSNPEVMRLYGHYVSFFSEGTKMPPEDFDYLMQELKFFLAEKESLLGNSEFTKFLGKYLALFSAGPKMREDIFTFMPLFKQKMFPKN